MLPWIMVCRLGWILGQNEDPFVISFLILFTSRTVLVFNRCILNYFYWPVLGSCALDIIHTLMNKACYFLNVVIIIIII